MRERVPNPKDALDYPALADDLWVIWYNRGGEAVWPSGARSVWYMSKNWTDSLRGWALMAPSYVDDITFATLDEALAFRDKQEVKRMVPYGNIEITTVAEIKRRIYGVEI